MYCRFFFSFYILYGRQAWLSQTDEKRQTQCLIIHGGRQLDYASNELIYQTFRVIFISHQTANRFPWQTLSELQCDSVNGIISFVKMWFYHDSDLYISIGISLFLLFYFFFLFSFFSFFFLLSLLNKKNHIFIISNIQIIRFSVYSYVHLCNHLLAFHLTNIFISLYKSQPYLLYKRPSLFRDSWLKHFLLHSRIF